MNTQTQTPVWGGAHKAGLAGLLVLQFAAATVIGTGHLLTNEEASLFLPIGITVAVPVALFLAAVGGLPPVRARPERQDPHAVAALARDGFRISHAPCL